jgi:hypothetical protein
MSMPDQTPTPDSMAKQVVGDSHLPGERLGAFLTAAAIHDPDFGDERRQ